jgi:hypothetical protein
MRWMKSQLTWSRKRRSPEKNLWRFFIRWLQNGMEMRKKRLKIQKIQKQKIQHFRRRILP